MLRPLLVLSILSICSARPNDFLLQNILRALCEEGQVRVDDVCRDISDNIADAPLNAPNLGPQNMITVPPNCPPGQEWINGQCRDVWRAAASAPDLETQNMITVPNNCPPGQQWINGQCRDVWRGGDLADSEEFRKLLESMWPKSAYVRNSRQVEDYEDNILADFNIEDDPTRNIISVPNHCPEGYKPDAYGICRRQL
ncbi:uncharacterized protein LOC112053031 isoform X1 [Bicyclus anynana]|uniref:Uncharacterized protein LOC112053031 isoform X1 n=1 Tax=Bicyclus anynana TaxID=110368 RepID=A0ABM3LEK6_BICAN|nr:uncharacterized protein LOC112053031 isoform X1 [Bicyclus anynana]